MRAARSPLTFSAKFAPAVALASLMLAAEPASAIFNIPTNFGYPDKTELQDSATSPDGNWVAERYLEFYPADTQEHISLHHPQKSSVKSDQFLPYIADDAVFKWLDNSTLLIAAPEESRLETKPDEFDGVRLLYGHFPNDPDTPRIAGSQKVFMKHVDFTDVFKKGEGEGLPGVSCYLRMTASDGEYLDHLSLQIGATRTFEIKGTKAEGYKIMHGYAGAGININTDKETFKSLSHATAAEIEGFSPHTDKNNPLLMQRDFRQATIPGGSSIPRWGLMYGLHGQNDIFAITKKIRSGDFKVKVGFWLDNAEVVYSSAVPKDASAVQAFETCIRDNNIFTSRELDNHGN